MSIIHHLYLAVTLGGTGKNVGAQVSQFGGPLVVGLGGLKALGHFAGNRTSHVIGTAILIVVVGAFFYAAPELTRFITDSAKSILK